MSEIRELSISRYIDAPPEGLGRHGSQQEEWWCPAPSHA